MFLIEKESQNEIIINKSKFINYLFKLNDLNEISKYLSIVKNEYKDAAHYCSAYIFDNVKRFSDDAEPNGTAGKPMLNVLENQNLNHVLTITVRYFGGIKLGAGGLTRAYTKSVTENLKNINIFEYIEGVNFDISVDFKDKNLIEKKFKINSVNYDNLINYNISVKLEDFDEIKNYLDNNSIEIKNLKNTYIKK